MKLVGDVRVIMRKINCSCVLNYKYIYTSLNVTLLNLFFCSYFSFLKCLLINKYMRETIPPSAIRMSDITCPFTQFYPLLYFFITFIFVVLLIVNPYCTKKQITYTYAIHF